MSRRRVAGGKLRHLNGWRRDRPDHRDRLMAPPPAALPLAHALELPRALPVFDQESIGSCTANMGCLQMAWVVHKDRVAKGSAESVPTFSRLFLYAFTRHLEGTPLAEDGGAEIRSVMKALAKFGTCLDELWPYDRPEERFSVEPSEVAKADALNHQALFYYRVPNLRTLKMSISQGFPVGFGFSVPNNMMSDECARTGLVLYPEKDEGFDGGHAVTAWGYDDNKLIDGERGAVLCQNSWGDGWGDKGFLWLPYRFFLEKLASDMWTLRRIEL